MLGIGGALWPRRQAAAADDRDDEDRIDRSRYIDPDFGTPPRGKS